MSHYELEDEFAPDQIPVEIRRQVLENRITQVQAKAYEHMLIARSVEAENWPDTKKQQSLVNQNMATYKNLMRGIKAMEEELDNLPEPEKEDEEVEESDDNLG